MSAKYHPAVTVAITATRSHESLTLMGFSESLVEICPVLGSHALQQLQVEVSAPFQDLVLGNSVAGTSAGQDQACDPAVCLLHLLAVLGILTSKTGRPLAQDTWNTLSNNSHRLLYFCK